MLRVENQNGKFILCGQILPIEKIKPGQVWISVSDLQVTVEKVDETWVEYSWFEQTGQKLHEKDFFSFQCRYCLILQSDQIPIEFLET